MIKWPTIPTNLSTHPKTILSIQHLADISSVVKCLGTETLGTAHFARNWSFIGNPGSYRIKKLT